MIITKSKPFTTKEIAKLRQLFDVYIKTVVDVRKKICSAGCDRHFESEKVLLDQGSSRFLTQTPGPNLKNSPDIFSGRCMNNQLFLLQSIASDLKRVALSLRRGSPTVAARFIREIIKHKAELEISTLPPYIQKLIFRLDQVAADPETALMHSTLLQNYTLHRSQTASS